jgi:hypothetical protein
MGNILKKSQKPEKTETDIIIDNLVKKMLENKKINLQLVPDSLEEKMYRTILEVLIAHIEDMTKTIKIQFLNHEITLDFHPIHNE